MLLFLLVSACEEEKCEGGELSPPQKTTIKGLIKVQGQYGNVDDYPVEVKFQKNFCDGAVGLLVEYPERTNVYGEYSRTQNYEFTNRKDEIHVQLFAGEGAARQEYIQVVYYNPSDGSVVVTHTFYVEE